LHTLELQSKQNILKEMRSGDLEVRLAASWEEIEAAQALRYHVFYEEMQAKPNAQMAQLKRDLDTLDEYCDHLIAYDHSNLINNKPTIIGTYRLIRQSCAKAYGKFYTSDEFNIDVFTNFKGNILELGRSCVRQDYRNKPTLQLLWRAIGAYMNHYSIEILFGCASFTGIDIKKLEVALTYLHHYHLAPKEIRPKALKQRYVELNRTSIDGLNPRRVFAELPPLIKGYLRAGGFIGEGAVIDEQFNTTDVCIVVQTELMKDRYTKFYDIEKPSQKKETSSLT
jgi:L-ornithine Nalpha-acyltransferase